MALTNSSAQKEIFGHPAGLYILFFTEMWERFSYYGMRALLVLYLISEISKGGLGWSGAEASTLYGWYTMFVYITPILGGILADKIFGFRNAIMIGAVLMTLGHLALAFDPMPAFYLGLILLILGNGLFKPNISSIVGQLYPEGSAKKDAGYTIFYMGINVGAFLGTLICGYLGEQVGWHYGFGAAGVFMFIGLIQFWVAQRIFGEIGLKPIKSAKDVVVPMQELSSEGTQIEPENPKVVKDRLIVVGVLAFFSIFFWVAFEQAGSSLNIFASKYTDRTFSSETSITIFKGISIAFNLLPLIILSVLFVALWRKIGKEYPLVIICMAVSLIVLSATAFFILSNQLANNNPEIPATWFQALNAFFIFTFAPIFSKIWLWFSNSKFNPSGPLKFAFGLILLGLGFLPMVVGSYAIPQGAETYNASIAWLIFAYYLHTMGELCLSPVGLSFVNKLSPKKLLGVMFGIWFFASALGNKLAGVLSSYMEEIAQTLSMSDFFQIFVYVPIAAGLLLMLLSRQLKKLMKGVK